MSSAFIIVVCLALAAVALWNLVPGARERMRGWTTAAEATLIAIMPFVGNLIDTFQETDWQVFVPPEAWPYIVAALAVWFF